MVFGNMQGGARRTELRDSLTDAAERAIARGGLAAIRARSLAAEAGCAVGAIYNVFASLDELVLAANSRTLAALERALAATSKRRGKAAAGEARFSGLAIAYLEFAAAGVPRWRALFDHRLPEGAVAPDWYLADQNRLFAFVEEPLRGLRPDLPADEIARLARTLFSAAHGVVALGLEEKLGVLPLPLLKRQLHYVMSALVRGLRA